MPKMGNTKKTILIIEDDSALRGVLSDVLSAEGFLVEKAANGEEGLAAALKLHPDMVLLDVVMPRMDGVTVLKKLREDAWGKNVPVLFLSNLSDSQKILESMRRGATDYLVKANWSIKEILQKVRDALKVKPASPRS